MAFAFETWLATKSPLLEFKFQDASPGGNIANSGSASVTMGQGGISTYYTFQNGPYSGYKLFDDSVDTKYWLSSLGSTLNTGWYSTDTGWMSGLTTGTMVFVLNDIQNDDCIFGAKAGSSTTENYFDIRFPNITGNDNEIQITIRGSGGASDELIIYRGRVERPTTDYPLLIIITQDGTGIKVYMQGKECLLSDTADSITAGDGGLWWGDLSGNVDGWAIGGNPNFSAGPTWSTMTDEASADWAYVGVFSSVFTADEAYALWGRMITGEPSGGGTVFARNKYRRYYVSGQGRVAAAGTGIDSLKAAIMNGGSSAAYYLFWLLKLGGYWGDYGSKNRYGDFWEEETAADIPNTSTYGIVANPDGNVCFGNDLTSTTKGIGWYWADGKFTPIPSANVDAAASGQSCPAVVHPDGKLWMYGLNTASVNPIVYEWDFATKTMSHVTSTYLDSSGTRGNTNAAYHLSAFSPDGNWAAQGSSAASPFNTVSTSGLNLWEITTTTDPNDTWTHVIPGSGSNSSTYAVAFDSTSTYCFQAISSTPWVRTWVKSGSTWSEDTSIWNNATTLTDFDTAATCQGTSFCCIGNDVYWGTDQANVSRTSYQNLFHLRWNGSYFEEQTVPVWPHAQDTPQVGVPITSITATPDGLGIIVTTTNAGANDIPCILAYDRNASTGALTLRDSPYDFFGYSAGGGTVSTSEADLYDQNPRKPMLLSTQWPPTDAS